MGRYTEAQKKSAEKYLSKFKEIKIRIAPDLKQKIEETARQNGMSVQAYVIESIKKNMES